MDYINEYKRRVGRNGKNIGDYYEKNTKAFTESMFHESPTFKIADVKSFEFKDIKTIDIRAVEIERMGSLRSVMFRRDEGLNIGSYIGFDGDIWLITDKWGNKGYNMVTVTVQRCNNTIKWVEEINKKKTVYEFDCITSQSPLGSKTNQGKNDIEWNRYDVRLPLGQLYVFFEKNDQTSKIKLNQRFIFGSNSYEIFGVDDSSFVDKNGFGIVQLTAKITTKMMDKDDFVNRLAYNKLDDSKVDIINIAENKDSDNGDGGGIIW